MGFGSVSKCTQPFPQSTNRKKKHFDSPGYIYLRFTVASSHYNSSQNIFPFSTGSFSLNQFGGSAATGFFFSSLQHSGITILRLTNSRLLSAFGSSRSKCVIIPNHRSWSFEGCVYFLFSLLLFCIFGSFYFIFQKKGYLLASGFGFLRNFVRMG